MSSSQPPRGGVGGGGGSNSGGGGKSLLLMQQRLLSKPQESAPQPAPAPAAAAPVSSHRPGKSAAHLLAAQAKHQSPAPAPVNTVPPPQPSPVPGGRPKGKDFAAMAMSAGAKSKSPTPAPIVQQQQPQQPQQQQQLPPQAQAMAAGGRPKGKDFGAMAARIGAPAPTPAPSLASMAAQAEATRKQKQIAAARAAAGYTPATSAVVVPAPAPPQAAAPTPMSISPAAVIAADARQKHMAKIAKGRATTSSAATIRRSNSTSLPKPVAPPPISTKPTQQPKHSEAKLAPVPGAAHISPLVGQRLRDLVSSIDPNFALDAQAEEQVLQLADDFLEKVTKQSTRMAQHRGSKTLDVQDIQFVLAKQWGIVVPGLGPPIRPSKPGGRMVAISGAGNGSVKRRGSDKSMMPSTKKAKPNLGAPVAQPTQGTSTTPFSL